MLHLGHAYSALLNWRMAGQSDGRFLLRIEDIDLGRARPEFEAAIYNDLSWLGLNWEAPVLKQSERFDVYRTAMDKLDRLGLLYPAFMTRRQIRAAIAEKDERGETWPRDPDSAPHYPGPERDWTRSRRESEMASGRPYALRIDMARAAEGVPELTWREISPSKSETELTADPRAWGDVIIARSDVPASYHLCVVVDDAEQEVTHIVRGQDLQQATAIHRLLQHLLGLPEPNYFHHRLIVDESGEKLSKRFGSRSLEDFRNAGHTPGELLELLQVYFDEPEPTKA